MDRKERLEEIREQAHRNGKEPFDFVKFASVYPHDTGTCERLKPDEPEWVRAQYEREYYLDHPEAMTIKEFAEILDRIDESY